IAKYFGGDPSWRDFSAMNEYYQNSPLPTWIGWYAAQLPRRFHQATAFVTVATELVVVSMVFLPRVFRTICFFLVTFLQIAIILTSNYAFLNHLVLALGIFLLDDAFLVQLIPRRWREPVRARLHIGLSQKSWRKNWFTFRRPVLETPEAPEPEPLSLLNPSARHEETASVMGADASQARPQPPWRQAISSAALWVEAFFLAWILYAML